MESAVSLPPMEIAYYAIAKAGLLATGNEKIYIFFSLGHTLVAKCALFATVAI